MITQALSCALKQGPVLCLYIIEPSLWSAPDVSAQHYHFILESLRELYLALKERGAILYVVTGEVVEVFQKIYDLNPFRSIFSHEETGNWLSYQRDLAVQAWCKNKQIAWQEFAQFGVVRRLKNRNLWKEHWDRHVSMTILETPYHILGIELPWQEPRPLTPMQLGMDPLDPPQRQKGGRANGQAILDSFLAERSSQYRGGISSPLSAPQPVQGSRPT